jgi:glycosyltransferase involved in cell wall biosynthesis
VPDLRICHVNLARGYRGGERQTELLIRELARRGITQRAIVCAGETLAQRLAEVPSLDLRPIRRPFVHRADLARGWLLHAHEANAGHVAHVWAWLAGSRYVVTRRVDNVPGWGWATRAMYRNAAAVVAISDAIARVLVRYDPVLVPQVIPSAQAELASDREQARRIRTRWPEKVLIGHTGALDNSQKGQLHLVRAARRLAATAPAVQIVLLGAGKDEAWLKTEAEGLANVTFEGHVENVGDYLAAFDLFVYPSLHEGLGSAILDAMSFGLPVVASAVDGIPEIVRDGENGLLVPPADDARLAEALGRLARDAALRERLGEAGRRTAAAHRPAAMVDRYLELYRRV